MLCNTDLQWGNRQALGDKIRGCSQFMMEKIQDSHWKIPISREEEILNEGKNEVKMHWVKGKSPALHHLRMNTENCRCSTESTQGHFILVGVCHS